MTPTVWEKSIILSIPYDFPRQDYQYIICDGWRWEIFRKVFEKKKWFTEGAFIGCKFLEFARAADSKHEYMREVILCYNFTLDMFDRADMPDAFCDTLHTGESEIDWTVFNGREDVNPLYFWAERYKVNERKIVSGRHKHIQNNEVLDLKLDRLKTLIDFLIKCT